MTNPPRESQRREPIDLALLCPWPAVGNHVDPQVSADAMRAKFAALDVGGQS
jgi:hypothetical protein